VLFFLCAPLPMFSALRLFHITLFCLLSCSNQYFNWREHLHHIWCKRTTVSCTCSLQPIHIDVPNHWTQLYTTDIVYYLVNVADNIWTSPTISEFSSVDLLPPIVLAESKFFTALTSHRSLLRARCVGFLEVSWAGPFRDAFGLQEGTPQVVIREVDATN
jgi:hypothetical protein